MPSRTERLSGGRWGNQKEVGEGSKLWKCPPRMGTEANDDSSGHTFRRSGRLRTASDGLWQTGPFHCAENGEFR